MNPMGGQDFFAEEIEPTMDFYSEEINKQLPHPENFLQRAIKQTIGKPLFQASDAPAIGHQFAEGIVGNAPQNVAQNPMTTAMSGLPGVQAKAGAQGISGIKDLIFGGNSIPNENTIVEDNKYLTPQTIGGKVLGLGANISGGLINPANVALGGRAVNALRTAPIKKEIRGIEDLILKSIQSEVPIKEEIDKISDISRQTKTASSAKAKETAYVGSKAIKEQVAGRFKDAGQRFGEEFSKLESRMGDEDLTKVIKNAANDIGAPDVPGTPGNQLMSMGKKYTPKAQEGVIQTQSKIYTKEEVQSITKEILEFLPDDRSKAIFHKHLIDALPESVPGLKELKASHAPTYKIAKESKFLKESNLNQIASGKAPASKVDDLSKYAERLGSSHVERAKKVAQQNKLEEMMLEQAGSKAKRKLDAKGKEQEFLKGKIPALDRKIGEVRFRQAIVGGIASLLGLGGAAAKLMGLENKSNR